MTAAGCCGGNCPGLASNEVEAGPPIVWAAMVRYVLSRRCMFWAAITAAAVSPKAAAAAADGDCGVVWAAWPGNDT